MLIENITFNTGENKQNLFLRGSDIIYVGLV